MDIYNQIVSGGYTQQLISIAVFLGAALAFASFAYWLVGINNPVERRLKEVSQSVQDEDKVSHREGAFNVNWVEPVAKIILPGEQWKRSEMTKRLAQGGFRDYKGQLVYLSSKVLLTIILPAIVGTVLVANSYIKGVPQIIAVVLLLAFIGYWIPNVILNSLIKGRQQKILEGFPDALDLLVVCVEAGLSLDAAINRVAKELHYSWPVLGDELYLMTLEMRADRSRKEALLSLADRTGVKEISALVGLLLQADQFGVSIAKSLGEHADEMRLRRIQRAKEKAAKLPVQMIFPIMLFIFPALFLVILGPAIVTIYASF